MNENLNLVEILKNVPIGTKLYSPVCGVCELFTVNVDFGAFPIVCIGIDDGLEWHFKANGAFTNNTGVECLLFPSMENRDWSTFKVPKKHKHFEPFQKVYIRGDANRSREVIKTLEDIGGINYNNLNGSYEDLYYYISPLGRIENVANYEHVLLSFIKEFYKEIKLPRWKPKYNERYYSVSWLGRVMSNKWYGTCDDETGYQFGNVFKTHKEAELVRDKIKKLLNQ